MSALDQQEVESTLVGFLGRMRPRLKVLFAHYKIPSQDSEDLLQQALLALLYRKPEVHDPDAWLMGTLRNKCLLYWREQRRTLYVAVDTAVLEAVAETTRPAQERADLRHDLEGAMGSLPRRCRSLLSLRYRQGYENPELAERMGYSLGSINKITRRCIAALTQFMVLPGGRKKKAEHD